MRKKSHRDDVGAQGISRKRVEEVIAKKGELTRWEMLRCRVRYFFDSAVLETKEFVNSIFEHERHRFGPRRRAAPARCATWKPTG